MEETEYMRIHSRYFLDDIRKQYNIEELIDEDGYVYVMIKKGMYGLKQAAIFAYKHLVTLLAPHGYRPCPNTLAYGNTTLNPPNSASASMTLVSSISLKTTLIIY